MPNTCITLSKKEFQKKLQEQGSILLDVRTLQEQKQYGVISDNQIHIDISLPNCKDKLLSLDTHTTYLIYCWHGVRSKSVGDFLCENGFEKVYDLEGGIDKLELF